MFFLGVLVGRGTAPALFDYQKIETEITALAKTFTDSRKAQNDMATDILTTQAGLEYPEELKKKTEDAAKMQMPASDKPARPLKRLNLSRRNLFRRRLLPRKIGFSDSRQA